VQTFAQVGWPHR